MSDAFVRVAALVRHNGRLAVRDPGPLISRLLMPPVMLALLHPLYRQSLPNGTTGIAQAATGIMVMFSMLAVSIVGVVILNERIWRTWDHLRSTPARAAEILFAKVIWPFGVLLLQQLVVVLFAVLIFGLRIAAIGLLAVALLVWCATLTCFGALLGTAMRTPGSISAVQDVGGMIFTGLGGVLVPLTLLPSWVSVIAPISPGYWGRSMLQSALQGDLLATVRSAAVLVVLGTVAGALACRSLIRGRTRG